MGVEVRRAVLRLLALAALVFVGDRLLAWAGSSALRSSELRFSVAARGAIATDVLVLGDSRAVNSFWPPELKRASHLSAFSLAFNGMSALTAEALLRDELARNPAPRVIVLEVTCVRDNHDLVKALAPYWSTSPSLDALARAQFPRSHAAAGVSHLFALNGEIFLRGLRYLDQSDQDWVNRFAMTPEILAAARATAPFELVAREENLVALGRMVALAREHGAELRLVIAPYLPEFIAHATNWDPFVAEIQQAAGASERIWDYGHADPDPAHFADRLHLNASGAVPFIERLARDGFFAIDTPASGQ
ncbi:MAG: hypothetical protein ACREBE_17380 [bacterium]